MSNCLVIIEEMFQSKNVQCAWKMLCNWSEPHAIMRCVANAYNSGRGTVKRARSAAAHGSD